ncbi:hypothetical protein Tco_0465876 [Tanacetum coccineum]
MTTLKFADTHNMVAFLSKPAKSDGFEQIVDFLNAQPIRYALTVNPTIYISCIKQFWSTGVIKTINEESQLHALVDGKKIIIFEASVRRYLKLEDEEGIDCLPNFTIFEQLALMGLKVASNVRRPSNRDSPFKNSVLSNTKKSSEKVEVFVMTNKKTYVASKNVVSDKKIVTNVDVKNALKAKDVLCVSCAKNVRVPCHDKCLTKYRLNEHSKVRRALFTTPRTAKSMFNDTTPVVSKTRFSVKTTQSKSLDITPVVSKTKIAAVTPLSSSNRSVDSITDYGDYVQGNITICHVYYVEGLGHNLFSVGQLGDGDLEVAFRSNTCYVRNLEGDDLLT